MNQVYTQNWLKFGSFFFKPSWVASRHRRPLASATIRALRSRSHPSVTLARTPTARPSSNRTLVTFTPCSTFAPASYACLRSRVSRTSRSTWKVNGCSFPGMSTAKSQTSMNFHSADRGEFHALPGLGTNPASLILSNTPSSWNTRLVEGTRDSPT